MNTKRPILFCLLLIAAWLGLNGRAQTVTHVAAGYDHSLFLKSDGTLWAMGYDYYGGLGDGHFDNTFPYGTNQPEEITNGVTAIGAGVDSFFLKNDGSLWGMGYNAYGELGNGSYNNTNRPTLVMPSGVSAVAVGNDDHVLFIETNGSLWAMGYDYNGQLGDGHYLTNSSGLGAGTNQPEEIETSNVIEIAAGSGHSLFLKNDGSLWAMGDNQYGQLGDGTTRTTNRPEEVVTNGVVAIAAGEDFSLFLKDDGSLWGMGYNFFGELGDGTTSNTNRPEQITNGVSAIATGFEFSLFLKSDGSLWTMGLNEYGQLGDKTLVSTNRPQMIESSGVTAISGGGFHSLFLKNDGSMWGMGEDMYGQLGDGRYATNAPYGTNQPEELLTGFPANENQLTVDLLDVNHAKLSFVGIAGTNYALDRTFNLLPAIWVPQITNPAGADGIWSFTNAVNSANNNFWRMRSVP